MAKKQKKQETPKPDKAAAPVAKPTAEFTKALASEIVKNLSSIGKISARPFAKSSTRKQKVKQYEHPMVVDTSILIDGRIVPIVNSGFLVGTLLVPKIVLGEVQHIADSNDSLRRAKGRRGLEVANALKGQKANKSLKTIVLSEDDEKEKEVDHKLMALAKKYKARLVTVDYNLAQVARAQKIKVLNINDLASAFKISILPGEEVRVKITHKGKERQQGVGYLDDGTMIVVEGAMSLVGETVNVSITKVHQTPAGQIFFAKRVG